MSEKTLETCALAIAEIGRRLYARGQLPATSGNLSLRLGEQSCAITVSGTDKGRLEIADVMAVDLRGRPLGAGHPSAETQLHALLYARFAAVGAVLHTHAAAAVVLSRLLPRSGEVVLRNYELAKALRGVEGPTDQIILPVFENDRDIGRLAGRVAEYFDRHSARVTWGLLIRSHGLYAWGTDEREACRHLEVLEYLLRCELELYRCGGVCALKSGSSS